MQKEKWKTMDVILVILAIFLLVFVIVMIAIYIRTGGIPDTDVYKRQVDTLILPLTATIYGSDDNKSFNKIFHSAVLGSYMLWQRDPYKMCIRDRN